MKKRIVSIFLTVALVIGILPQMTMPVQAADPAPVYAVLTSTGLFEATSAAPTIPIQTTTPIADNKTVTNLYVADDVTSIGKEAFWSCTALETVTMPVVTQIDARAFNSCTALETVTMPVVTQIGDGAFRRCESLTTITMPEVTSIGMGAFTVCESLTTITMPEVTSIDMSAFSGCTNLANLTVGAKPPTTVGANAFKDCLAIGTLKIDKINAKAVADYIEKGAADDIADDGLWFGWTLPAPPALLPASLDISKGSITVSDGTNADTIKVIYNDGAEKTVDNLPMDTEIIITGTTTSNTVIVNTAARLADNTTTKTVNITLKGVNIDVNLREEACAFDIQNNSDVNLTLADGTTNTLKSGKNRAGLQVNSNDTKTITATVNINGKGSLNTTGGKWGAGIGGVAYSMGGNIIINDGTITATGGTMAAGIGGGRYKTYSNITINGGTIVATGGNNAAGIGLGLSGTVDSGEIIISGGNVTAIGGWKGQGIGEGTQSQGATIKIDNDANVIAVLGYEAEKEAIGSVTGPSASGKTVANILRAKYSTDLDVGTTIAVKNSNGEDLTPSVKYKTVGTTKSIAFSVKNTGDYTVYNGGTQAEKQQAHKNDTTNGKFNVIAGLNIFEEVKEYTVPVIPTIPASLDISKGSITVSDGTNTDTIKVLYNDGAGKTVDNLPANTPIVITGTTDKNTVTVDTPATKTVKITLKDANINVISIDKKSAFDIQGVSVVSLTLDGNSTLKSGSNQAGLQVQRKDDQTATVTINGTGALNATGYRGGAGIGSGVNNPGNINNGGGNITIGGANVTATGGELGAGIGGGTNSAGGDITISGGTVISTGGSSGAGIGGGHDGQSGNIIIGGATVIATGGQNAAGIGRGGSFSIMPLIGYVKIDDTSNIIAVSTGQKDAIDGNIIGNIEGKILIAKYKNAIKANIATTLRDISGKDLSTPVTYTPTSSYQSIAFSGLKNSAFTLYNGVTQQVHGTVVQNKIFDVSVAGATRFENVQDYVTPLTTYTVSYNSNGGTGTMASQPFTEGTPQNLTSNTFARTGYTFAGWNTLANGNGTSYAEGASYTATANVTLYAKWTKNDAGTVTVIPETKPNTPAVSLPNDVKDQVLTGEDKTAIQNGEDITITLNVEKVVNPASEDISKVNLALNGQKLGIYLDINLLKKIGAANQVKIKSINGLMKIKIAVPNDLKPANGVSRAFKVIRVHNDGITVVVDTLNDLDTDLDIITIETDKFSTYAIAYKDTAGGGGSTGGSTTDTSEIEKLIIDLTTLETFKEGDLSAFEKVEKEYNKLTNEEKSLIDETLHNKYKVILKQVEAMRKATEKPVVVKPTPVIAPTPKPTKNPKTGDETPMSLPITFVTLGLALMALGFYLKGKGKQQAAE